MPRPSKAQRISRLLDRMEAPRGTDKPPPRARRVNTYLKFTTIDLGRTLMREKNIDSFSKLVTEAIEFYAEGLGLKVERESK